MASTALELRHLETLLALAECGSLSKAASRLFLTQSALSHQLRALEAHFGAAVVEKNVRPLRFTAIGQRLLGLARVVLPQVAEAGRDVARLAQGHAGPLRVVVQCHNCFDWLMPAMDAYRSLWPEVELDILSGFVVDPLPLLERGEAELAVVHDRQDPVPHITFSPLFRYESVALMSPRHRLAAKSHLSADDFAEETLITYPVPDIMLDVMKHCLTPAGINPKRRTAELTVAILQLVASGRGIAALPSWTVGNYIERGYVVSRPIGAGGLRCELYAATTRAGSEATYIKEFITLTRSQSLTELAGVSAL
ncbi:MAG TPA: LysR family transcriptional regulator [Steroidobacteraceae bacterium]|nr:LysR family transcriptional regulator [Steroidobacteraceae bacterium]